MLSLRSCEEPGFLSQGSLLQVWRLREQIWVGCCEMLSLVPGCNIVFLERDNINLRNIGPSHIKYYLAIMSFTINKRGLSKEAWAKFCLVLCVVVYPVLNENLRISGLWLSYENSLVLENSRRKNTTSKYNIYMIFSGFFFFFFL